MPSPLILVVGEVALIIGTVDGISGAGIVSILMRTLSVTKQEA